MKIRNPLLDLVKGVAVILMIQVHLTELFARQDIAESTIGKLSLFLGGIPVAPVFLLIMGYFLAVSRKNTFETIVKGIKLFFLGLILNLGLNTHLLYRISKNEIKLNPWNYILGIDILVSAGVAIIIIAILKKVIKNNVLLFIVFAFSIAYAPKILPVLNPDTSSCLFFYSLFWGNTSWSYFPIFPWLAYPITGYSIKLLEDKIKVKKTFLIAAGMLSIFPIMFTASFGINISTNLRRYYHHGYDFFLWSLFFMLIWISSLWIIEYNFSSSMVIIYLKWVGKNVTSFYIFQWLIIGNIATAVYKTVSQKKLVLWFIAILITTNALVLLLNKIRCSKHK